MDRMQWYMSMLAACAGVLLFTFTGWAIISQQWFWVGAGLSLTIVYVSLVQVRSWSTGSTWLTRALIGASSCLLVVSIVISGVAGDIAAAASFTAIGCMGIGYLLTEEMNPRVKRHVM